MKTRKFIKRTVSLFFALSLMFCVLEPTVKVHAMEGSARTLVELRYINADGVRLYKEANPNSTILGLMYIGDRIDYYPEDHGAKPYENYVYMIRKATPSAGYVASQYTTDINPLS